MDNRLCFILALVLATRVSGFHWWSMPIGLEDKSTVYVPYRYGVDGTPDFYDYDRRVAAVVAVDKTQHIAYTIGMCKSICFEI